MRKITTATVLLVVLLMACSSGEPQATTVDIEATVDARVATAIASQPIPTAVEVIVTATATPTAETSQPTFTEEEAIQVANDTPYGLTNYIQTQDKEKVKRVARKLRSGMVDVNGAGIAVDAPFGGFKHSGIGREAGEHGLEEFLEVKSVGGWNN